MNCKENKAKQPAANAAGCFAGEEGETLADHLVHVLSRMLHGVLGLVGRVLNAASDRGVEHRACRYHRNDRACHRAGGNAGNKGRNSHIRLPPFKK